jgi:Domain of unknown function (DUF1996)
MQASSKRTWQGRLVLMLILGVASVAACVLAFMWGKAPAASAQDDQGDFTSRDASFVVRCDFIGLPSGRKLDDPIVSPGVDSFHMHDFFGNTTTNRNSTLDTLRAGGTTCLNPGDKSAYWMPTATWTDSKGTRTLNANRGLFYYRAGDKDADAVELYPALDTNGDGQPDDGLKIVTVQGSHATWKCEGSTAVFPSPPSRCSSGKLVVRIVFPDCSDGNIDSATHRSHMTYAEPQSDGTMQCPPSHPKPVPALTMNVRFPIPTTSGTLTLSSDHLDQGDSPGSTIHADFYNAWDQVELSRLIDTCIKAAPFSARNPKPSECKLIN